MTWLKINKKIFAKFSAKSNNNEHEIFGRKFILLLKEHKANFWFPSKKLLYYIAILELPIY